VDPFEYPQSIPDCDGIPHGVQQAVLTAPFNDLATTVALIEQHHRDLAAIIIEPLQRALKPEPGFLEGLRAVTQRYGIVLVFDEVVTGFRLAWGGAQERYGVVPDLACYGKVIGGGYPLSAVAGKRELLQLADPQQKGRGRYCFLSGTPKGNPVASAAGPAALGVLLQSGTHQPPQGKAPRMGQGPHRAGAAAS